MSDLERISAIEIDGKSVPIEWGPIVAMLGGFEQGGYDFEPALFGDREAGFYHLPAGRATRVVKIVEPVVCVEWLAQGAAWFLKSGSNGDIESHEFRAGMKEKVSYGLGDTIVWGAAREEARVSTVSDKPFVDSMEVNVEVDSTDLPTAFWDKYHELSEKYPPFLSTFEWEGQNLPVEFVETDTQVSDGVECDVYRFKDDPTKDLGIIRVAKGCASPDQVVLGGDRTVEGYIKGEGKLIIIGTDGNRVEYETGDNTQNPFVQVEVKVGDRMQLVANPGSSLETFEICYPPYADGRYLSRPGIRI